MKNVMEKIDLNTYRKLVKILGEEREYVLKPLEFEVSSDRKDADLPSYIMGKAKKLQEIADAIGCEVEDFKMDFDFEQSDHELAVHQLSLNNKLEIGGYCLFRDQLHVIEDVHFGIFHIKNLDTGETKATSQVYLGMVHWGQIFMIRDKMEVNEVY